MSKILLEVVKLAGREGGEAATLTATFNYNLDAPDLLALINNLLSVKLFSQSRFRLAHFEVRNGHISDYNRGGCGQKLIDDLDQFEKEIDNCLRLERLWKINEYLTYRQLDSASIAA